MLEAAADALGRTIDRAGEIFAEAKQVSIDVGEKAISVPSEGMDTPTSLLFVRCHALVYIHLETGKTDVDAVTAYAKRLDEILSPVVCR